MAAATKTTRRKTATKKRAPRKAAPKEQAPVQESVAPAAPPVDDETARLQLIAKIEAYSVLTTAGLPIPEDLARDVEAYITSVQVAEKAVEVDAEADEEARLKEDETGPKWVRNTYHAPFSLRLQRQNQKQGIHRIELAARGQRGDMFPLEDDDLHDHVLIRNLGTGLIELIGDGTARRIAAQQTYNIQPGTHTLALIRNENGQPIEKLTVETEYNKQGVVVGYVDPNVRRHESPIVRPYQQEKVQQFVPTGGNPAIISQGPVPTPLDANAQARIQDQLARAAKGPEALGQRPEQLLGLRVSINPANTRE